MAWAFLSVGIALGSWWAYYELGWGGYWFWDPVENASFMPWLVGTALIHSLAATEKRGVFKSWTLLLAILAFSLSLLGTFLVRSGVLTSVHSFAADPDARPVHPRLPRHRDRRRAGAVRLARADAASLRRDSNRTAREAFLLYNNILLVVAAAMVLVGTLAPLIADALGAPPLSVGSPYLRPDCSRCSCCRWSRWWPSAFTPSWKRGQLGEAAGCASCIGFGVALVVGLVRGLRRLWARQVAHAGRRGARHLDHPVVAVRSDRPAAPQALAAARDHRHDARAHRPRRRASSPISTVESYTVERDAAIATGRDAGARAATPTASTASRRSKALTTTACAPKSRCCATACRSRRCIRSGATTGCSARRSPKPASPAAGISTCSRRCAKISATGAGACARRCGRSSTGCGSRPA